MYISDIIWKKNHSTTLYSFVKLKFDNPNNAFNEKLLVNEQKVHKIEFCNVTESDRKTILERASARN